MADLAALALYDVVILVNDSASMLSEADRLEDAKGYVTKIAQVCLLFNLDHHPSWRIGWMTMA